MTSNQGQSLPEKAGSAPRGLRLIQAFYAFWVFLWLLIVISKLVDAKLRSSWIEIILNASVPSLIFWGIKKRKDWVVGFILIFAAWSIVWMVVRFFGITVRDTGTLVFKAGTLLVTIFFAYQIHLFSKKDTRQYFKEKDDIFF